MERYDGKLHRPDQPGRNYAERLSRIEKAVDVLLGRAQLTINDASEVAPAEPAPYPDTPHAVGSGY
jgi:hypothetical protein